MDCQGTDAVKHGCKYLDNLLLHLSMKLANVHIANVQHNLTSTDLLRMMKVVLNVS